MQRPTLSEHLQAFGIRVGSSPRKFGLYGTEDGSDVSAADAVSLQKSDSGVSDQEEAASYEALPLHQQSPAHLVQTEGFEELMASRSQTPQDVLRVLQQLEAYKVLSRADPIAFKQLWQQPARQRLSASASKPVLALELLGSLAISSLFPAAFWLHYTKVQTAGVVAVNLLQIWAWLQGTSLVGRLLGLWWEEPDWKHAAPPHLIIMACLADCFYAFSTLGLGGVATLCRRSLTGQSFGERWAGVHMIHEGWQPM